MRDTGRRFREKTGFFRVSLTPALPRHLVMREAFRDQAALDAHFSMPYFQRFAATADDLLQEPLQLIFLEQVSA